ncbi:MAG TPA: response regulator [Terriglobales bacterium]|nr:response regulator [Terriglobales bacterium]
MPNSSVLIVDDNPDVRDLVRMLLEDHDYRVLTAEDGGEALEVLRGATNLPDVIILDLAMPRVDGFAFRREQLRDPELANIPVIVLSANPDIDVAAAQLNAAACFNKASSFAPLATVVAQVCSMMKRVSAAM